MRFCNLHCCARFCILAALLFFGPGCGEESDKPDFVVAGTLAVDESMRYGDAPVLVAVTRSLGASEIQEDPDDAIIKYVAAGENGTSFEIDLSDTALMPGDTVNLIAFVDNNYTGGVPFPDIGDIVGIHVEPGSLTPGLELQDGGNTGIHIDITREVFDYEASISGTVTGDDEGNVVVVAYAGEVASSDFSGLDTDDVMGFARVEKGSGPVSYTIDILPYGKNVPLEKVQVFALLDANANNEIDAGDRIGFYAREGEFSSLLALEDGTHLDGVDPVFRLDIPEPSGYDVSMSGTFSVSQDYLAGDSPVYITVFDSANPGDILEDPYGALKYFYKMPAYAYYFTFDLSRTDLAPGDKVMVVALWDRDFAGGFPQPTRGDKLGIVVNKDTYRFLTEIAFGPTIIPPVDHEFKINKRVYDFRADIDYALDLSDAGSFNMDNARLIVLAIHVEGVALGVSAVGDITLDIDMDYMIAVDSLPATEYDHIGIGPRQDPFPPRALPLLTALYERVVVWEDNLPPQPLIRGEDHGNRSERTAFLVAILDKNGNGAVDREDEIGYYGKNVIEVISGVPVEELPENIEINIPSWFSGILTLPTPIKRIVSGRNHELREDGSAGPYWIGNFTRVP
ncbi:MAG: hypothetical protein ACQEQN_11360 [Thermodesulfobacteriota bacterium]